MSTAKTFRDVAGYYIGCSVLFKNNPCTFVLKGISEHGDPVIEGPIAVDNPTQTIWHPYWESIIPILNPVPDNFISLSPKEMITAAHSQKIDVYDLIENGMAITRSEALRIHRSGKIWHHYYQELGVEKNKYPKHERSPLNV